MIFPISGNNTFESSDFADPRFSLSNSDGGLLSESIITEKVIAKHEINNFMFSLERVFPFSPFD